MQYIMIAKAISLVLHIGEDLKTTLTLVALPAGTSNAGRFTDHGT